MTGSVDRELDIDWSAVAMGTIVLLMVAAGFLHVALTPQWESGEWASGLVALIPFE